MKMKLESAFLEWQITVEKASSSFVILLRDRFPGWTALQEFVYALPVAQVKLERATRSYCYLWPEKWIIDALDMSQSNRRYLPIGSLMDGSTLAIDTMEEGGLSVGAFAYEKTVNLEDEQQYLSSNFRRFPFSYPAYLRYMLDAPSDNKYFKG